MLVETRYVSGLYATVRRLVSARRVIGSDGCFVVGRSANATIGSGTAGPGRKFRKRDAPPASTEAGSDGSEFLGRAERMRAIWTVWCVERHLGLRT
jgi:hypothetical protein